MNQAAVEIKEQMKRENRIAAGWLIHYRERKRDHDEKRQEILAGTRERDENVGGGHSSILGRPTEAMAIKLEEPDNSNTAKWLWTVELVKDILGPKKSN